MKFWTLLWVASILVTTSIFFSASRRRPPKPPDGAAPLHPFNPRRLDRAERLLTAGYPGQAAAELNVSRVPKKHRSRFGDLKQKLDLHRALVAETTQKRVSAPPTLHRFRLKSGTVEIATILGESEKQYLLEPPVGVPMHLPRMRLEEKPVQLTAEETWAHLVEVLQGRCASRGILLDLKTGVVGDDPEFKDQVRAVDYFDMAAFCIEKGLRELFPVFIDQARQRDPEIVRTVHESQGERFVNMARLFSELGDEDIIRDVLTRLNEDYSDTEAYRRNRTWLLKLAR